jgi:hypothetical protein
MNRNIKIVSLIAITVLLLFSVSGCGGCSKDVTGGSQSLQQAGQDLQEPVAPPDGGAVPAAVDDDLEPAVDDAGEALPELQVRGFHFFPRGSDRPAFNVHVNDAGTLRIYLKNNGNADARNIEAYVRLDDGPRDAFNIDNMPANREIAVERLFKFNAPADNPNIIKISINEGRAIRELDDNYGNNIFNGMINVLPFDAADLPDLQATTVDFTPVDARLPAARVPVNTIGWLNGRITNAGRSEARNVTAYLQLDNGVKHETVFRDAIPAGAGAGFSVPVTLDREGKYIMRLVVNSNNAVRESDSANDLNNEVTQIVFAENPAPVAEDLPELQAANVVFLSLDAQALSRTPVNTEGWLYGTVRNVGLADGKNVFGYLQVDDGEQHWFILQDIPAGDPNAVVGHGVAIRLTEPGQHLLRLHINPTHTIPESDFDINLNEDPNNEMIQTIEVTGAVQQARQALESGVDVSAVDIGFIPARSADYADEVYVGTKGSISGFFKSSAQNELKDVETVIEMDDRPLKEYKKNIPPGVLMSYTIPDYWFTAEGRYKLTIKVDPDNKIKELDEKNNTRSCYINVLPRKRASRYDESAASQAAAISSFFTGAMQGATGGGSGYVPTTVSTQPPSTPSSGYQTTPPPTTKTTTPAKIKPTTYKPGTVKLNK